MKQIKRFKSGEVEISYAKYQNDGKKAIIFVHGNGENGSIFNEIAENLQQNYTVFCPDTRSHGESQKVNELKYLDIADDIANLIKHEKIEKPLYFGFSDGGIVGLLIAIKYPNLLEKMCVAGINLSPNGLKKSTKILIRLGFFFTRSDKLRLMLEEPNITEDDLKQILIPTTVFHAEKDVVTLKDSKIVVANSKNCKLIKVFNENHASYVLNNKKLENLLKENDFFA